MRPGHRLTQDMSPFEVSPLLREVMLDPSPPAPPLAPQSMLHAASIVSCSTARTSSTISSGAFDGDPASNGGCGSYSIAS